MPLVFITEINLAQSVSGGISTSLRGWRSTKRVDNILVIFYIIVSYCVAGIMPDT